MTRPADSSPYAGDPGYAVTGDGYEDRYDRAVASGPAPSPSGGAASQRRVDERRFDDGRYNLRTPGNPVYETAGSTQPDGQRGRPSDAYASGPPPHQRGQYSPDIKGRLNFYLGGRDLDDDNFRGAEEPISFAIEYSQAVQPGQIGFEAGFGFSYDEQDDVFFPAGSSFPTGIFDVERDTAEFYGGLRAEFELERLSPYLGAGLVVLNMSERREQGFLDSDDDDTDVGGYFHCGARYDVNDQFFLGLDFRRVFGTEAELYGATYDTDYGQISFLAGVSL